MTDSFGRKEFDELQLGSATITRNFSYHSGKVTPEHTQSNKVISDPTTQLVSQIILSNGTTLSYGYDAEERITSVVDWAKDGAAAAADWIVEDLPDIAADAWEATTDFIEDAWDATTDFIEDTGEAIGDFIEDAGEAVGGFFEDTGNAIGGFFAGIFG